MIATDVRLAVMFLHEADSLSDERFLTRRRLLQAAALSGVMSAPPAILARSETKTPDTASDDDVSLDGVLDLHVHAMPDSAPRAIDELEFARQARQAGYRGVMFKSNDFSSHDRAYLIQRELPGFWVFGGLCLNRVFGDKVNAHAVRKAVQTTGNACRCIWLPTLDAAYQYRFLRRKEPGIPVLDTSGKVLPEVVRVMEICAEANIILATGHSSPEESLALTRKAKEVGVRKFVVTHANSNFWKLTHDQVRHIVELGSFMEYSYITNLWGPGTAFPEYERLSDEAFSAYVSLAPERSFVTTDLGQIGMLHPLDGMRRCIALMHRMGIPASVIAAVTPTVMVVATTLEDERNLRVEGGGARLS
jgi:hypothetical protein